jgi:hypothetical protein
VVHPWNWRDVISSSIRRLCRRSFGVKRPAMFLTGPEEGGPVGEYVNVVGGGLLSLGSNICRFIYTLIQL